MGSDQDDKEDRIEELLRRAREQPGKGNLASQRKFRDKLNQRKCLDCGLSIQTVRRDRCPVCIKNRREALKRALRERARRRRGSQK